MIRFQCLKGCRAGEIFEFSSDSIVLGRDASCDLTLDDAACSRRHVRIEERGERYVIEDCGSTNGLLVNDQRVVKTVIGFGDRFVVGRNLFIFLSAPHTTTEAFLDNTGEPFVENSVRPGDVEKTLSGSLAARAMEGAENEEEPELAVGELRRVHQLLRTVYDVSRDISATLETADLFTLISKSIFERFPDVERVAFFVVPRGGSEEELELVQDFSRVRGPREEAAPVSQSVLAKVREEGIAILASDATTDDRFSASRSVAIRDVRSLMCVPLISRKRFLGAIYVENCSRPGCFQRTDLELLVLLGNQAALALENALLYEELQVSFYETVRSLCNALEAKDKYTRGHSERVARYAVGIGRELGLSARELEELRTAAELHDIGKIAIGEKIISKSGRLTDREYEIMKKHPQLGVEILKPIRFLAPVLPYILHHHERYDGKGYPDGLKGEEIPLAARILNLADTFDAMTTKRPYNTPISCDEAIERCRREAGVSLDARCVRALERYLEKHGPATVDDDSAPTEIRKALPVT